MKINLATKTDVKPILAMLQEHLIDIDDPQTHHQKNGGFLIMNFSEQQITEMILDDKNNLVLVVKKDDFEENAAEKAKEKYDAKEDKMLGYLTSSRFGEISEDLQKNVLPYLQKEKINDLEKVIYYRQIAVKTNSGVKNIGSFLIENFFREAKISGYQYAVCRIVLEPICNQKSISFHQKFGFKQIGIAKESGFVSGVYLKDLARPCQS